MKIKVIQKGKNQPKKTKKMIKRKLSQKGNGCAIQSQPKTPDCIPDVNMSQYKCPCNYLPLDGPKHNVYPLSNNPPVKQIAGGVKKKIKRKLTEYNKFMSRELNKLKNMMDYKNLKHKELFKIAAKNWNKTKKNVTQKVSEFSDKVGIGGP